MAVLALGLAGAALGNALVPGVIAFGITGASAGWMIGSAIGSMLGPGQHVEGPRVGDRPVTSSTVGSPMSTIYGAARVAGNVIQCSQIREVSHTQRMGKGGPKGSSTTYTYNVDIAIDLCAGPIAGIRKMWMDGKLVYDVSTANTDVGAVMASSAHAKTFVFYSGDEAQLPDPTLEALSGVGNVPAYRGRCYVVFSQLDCPYARIPQLTFEVVQTASGSTPSLIYATTPTTTGQLATIGANGATQFPKVAASNVWKIGPGYGTGPQPADFSVTGVATFDAIPVQGGAYAMRVSFSGSYSSPMTIWIASMPGGGMSALLTYIPGDSGNSLRPKYAAYDPVTGKFCAVADSTETGVRALSISILPANVLTETIAYPGTPMAFYNDRIYNACNIAGVAYLDVYDGSSGLRLDRIAAPAGVAVSTWPLLHADATGVYLANNDVAALGTARAFWKIDPAARTWRQLTATGHWENANGHTTTMYCTDAYAIVGPGYPLAQVTSGAEYRLIPFTAIDSTDPTVASIILDQCSRAGLPAGKVDVSGITDTVRGYPIHRVSPARANIEPLCKAFFIDAADVDGKIVFKKRANAAVATTITYDELAAVEGGGTPGDPFPLVRTQEVDLPRSLTVSFIDINADYQPGAEQAIRQITTSINDLQEDIAIVTDGTQAKQVAEVRLFDMWSARNARTGKVTRKYAFLAPGDLVPIEYPAGTIGQWLLLRVQDSGLLIEFSAVEANAALYQSAGAGAVTASGQKVDALPPPTALLFADIPLLRDVDNYAGAYVALAGLGSSWHGSTLYSGLDASTLSYRGDVTVSAPQGWVENALGAWTLGQIDETNLLTVGVGPDTLASTTRDGVVAGTDNLCIVGAAGRWEVCQFIRAAALGNGRYTLSGWKRGMLGTEQYRGTHQASDSFCLLTLGGVLKPHVATVEINTAKHYQAVSTGAAQGVASDQIDTDTGVCLKPLSPIDLRVVPQGGGVSQVSWGRRSRLSTNWLAGIVPVGEASEHYEIDVQPPASAITTLTATARSVNVTAVAGTVVTVYQMSDSVGRGYPASITL